MSVYNQIENSEFNSKEWLSLKLGQNIDLVADNGFLSSSSSTKLFLCNFCRRKFYNSQALGGHQNAHRNEKKALQRCQSGELTTIIDLSVGKPVIQSLGIKHHSLVHKPGIVLKPTASRFNRTHEDHWMERSKLVPEEIRAKWTGSFCIASKAPKKATELLKVDLDLRL